MFIRAIPDNKGKTDGYYCSLVESKRINGVSRHITILSLGYITKEKVPYLKAAFNQGDPAEILSRSMLEEEKKHAKA